MNYPASRCFIEFGNHACIVGIQLSCHTAMQFALRSTASLCPKRGDGVMSDKHSRAIGTHHGNIIRIIANNSESVAVSLATKAYSYCLMALNNVESRPDALSKTGYGIWRELIMSP